MFNPATPLDWLMHTLDKLDLVLIMSVNPGFGGQSFIPQRSTSCARRASWSMPRCNAPAATILLEVDGGVQGRQHRAGRRRRAPTRSSPAARSSARPTTRRRSRRCAAAGVRRRASAAVGLRTGEPPRRSAVRRRCDRFRPRRHAARHGPRPCRCGERARSPSSGCPTLAAADRSRDLIGKGDRQPAGARRRDFAAAQPTQRQPSRGAGSRATRRSTARCSAATRCPSPACHAMLVHFAARGFGWRSSPTRPRASCGRTWRCAGIDRYFDVVDRAATTRPRKKPDAAPMLLAAQRAWHPRRSGC